jgi:hypothetical protein
VESGFDVLEELQMLLTRSPARGRRAGRQLRRPHPGGLGDDPLPADLLALHLGQPPGELQGQLLALELAGLLERLRAECFNACGLNSTCLRFVLTDRVEPCSTSLFISTRLITVPMPAPSRLHWPRSCRPSVLTTSDLRGLVWLTDLTAMAGVEQSLTAASTGTRFYVDEETDALGGAAIGFIQFLESAKVCRRCSAKS